MRLRIRRIGLVVLQRQLIICRCLRVGRSLVGVKLYAVSTSVVVTGVDWLTLATAAVATEVTDSGVPS